MDEKKMRVLVLSHSSSIGGATASLDVVVTDLMENGYEVRLITPEGPMQARWRKAGIEMETWKAPDCAWLGGLVYSSVASRFHWIHLALLALLPFRLWKARRMIRRAFETDRIDFVLINSLILFPLGLIFPQCFRGRKPIVIWHLRDVLNAELGGVSKRFIQWAVTHATDRIIAITSNEKVGFETFAELYVIHNSIPVKWRTGEIERPVHNSGKIKVMMASMLVAGKGFEEFLQVAQQLRQEFAEVTFDLYTPRAPYPFHATFIGFPDTRRFLEKLLRNLSAIEVVPGVNWMFEREMSPELFAGYDIYVRPDRAGCPWGRDIIEAMWLGLPIVATGTSGEFIRDGVTGFLVPPRDCEALADRIRRLVENHELRESMRAETRRRAVELFDPSIHRKKILRVFRNRQGSEVPTSSPHLQSVSKK